MTVAFAKKLSFSHTSSKVIIGLVLSCWCTGVVSSDSGNSSEIENGRVNGPHISSHTQIHKRNMNSFLRQSGYLQPWHLFQYFPQPQLYNNNNEALIKSDGERLSNANVKRKKGHVQSEHRNHTLSDYLETTTEPANNSSNSLNSGNWNENADSDPQSKSGDDESRKCPACVGTACDTNNVISGLPVIQILAAIKAGIVWAKIFLFLYKNFVAQKETGGGYGYGPPPAPSYGPPPAPSYGPPPAPSYGPPPAPSYGPPPAPSYGPPPAPSYGPPPAPAYGPPPAHSYGPPPEQSYGAPPSNSYGSPPSHSYEHEGPSSHSLLHSISSFSPRSTNESKSSLGLEGLSKFILNSIEKYSNLYGKRKT